MSRRSDGPAEAAPLFAALGDETRLALLARLCEGGPASIARLTEGAAVPRQAVAAGLGDAHGRGRYRVWELDAPRLAEAQRYLDRISRRWDEALERLRKLVEE